MLLRKQLVEIKVGRLISPATRIDEDASDREKITQKAARIDINPGQIIPACQSETKHTGAVNDSGRGGHWRVWKGLNSCKFRSTRRKVIFL